MTLDEFIDAMIRDSNRYIKPDGIMYINKKLFADLEVLREEVKRQDFLQKLFNIIVGLSLVITFGIIYLSLKF